MQRVFDQDNERAGRTPCARARWLFAIAMLAAGIVPMSQMAKAVGPSAAAPACSGATYAVVSGDSWSLIASRLKINMADLTKANAATTATVIHPGQTLCLPSGNASIAPTTTTPPVPTARPAAAASDGAIDAFPVQGLCTFTDTYGAPRSNGRFHEGVDIIAKAGQWIYAAKDGTLNKKYVNALGSLSGNGWRLTAADGTYFFYAHLSAFASGLSVGSTVKAGQIIGQVGMTGNAPIPHLHFEIHPGGGPSVNPTPIVKAVDGCKNTAVLPQPGDVVPATTTPTTLPAPPVTASPAPAAVTNRWQFIPSVVALDTTTTGSPLSATEPTKVRVDNLTGVAADTSAVLVRLGTSNAAGNGFLLAHPCDGAFGSSTLNYSPSLRANGVAMVRVVAGAICLTTTQPIHVKVEVVAIAGSTGTGPVPIATVRAIDTRLTARPAANSQVVLSASTLGIPPTATAISVSVTVIDPAVDGSVSIGACNESGWRMPFSAQPVASYSTAVRINDSGLCLTPSISVHLLVDVTAVWTPDAIATPTNPTRLFDARTGAGTIGTTPESLVVAGVGGVPLNANAALLNVTIVGGAGFVYPCDQPRPDASAVSASPGAVSSALVPVRLSNGTVCISTFTPVPVVVDLVGVGRYQPSPLESCLRAVSTDKAAATTREFSGCGI